MTRRGELSLLSVVAAIWVAAWLATLPFGDTPMTDDWAYAFAVKSILAGDGFRLTGFTAPNLIAQAYWGALFCWPGGFSYQALRLSTAVLALFGVVAACGLFRELGADRGTAAMGALTLGASPLFLQLSDSFMTDVPFIATSVVSIWLYVRGTLRQRPGLVVGAYGVALLSLLIRQFAFALPVAFAVAHVCRRGFGPRALAVAAGPVLVFAAIHVGLQHWIVAASRAPRFAEAMGELSHVSLGGRLPMLRLYLASMVPYFGLFCLPFIAWLVATRRFGGRTFWAVTLVLAALIAAGLWARDDALPTLGNGLAPFGVGPLLLFDTYFRRLNIPVVPVVHALWAVLTLGGSFGTALLITTASRFVGLTLSRPGIWPEASFPAAMLTFAACITAAIVAAMLLDQVFDRYLLAVIVPLCAFLFAVSTPRAVTLRARLAGATPLAACLLLAVVMVHDYVAFQRERWAAIGQLEAAGVPATRIDGGFEFGGDRLFDVNYRRQPGVSWWWIRDNAYVIGLGALPGYEVIGTRAIPLWMPTANYRIYVLKRGLNR